MFKITEVIDMTGHTATVHTVVTFQRIEPVPFDFHALWQELHSEVRTLEQFEYWVKKVPNFGCSCASWLEGYLASNQPTDDSLERFGWELHNAVNAKLGKPFFSQADFESKYG